jgi:tetratricopeptide (TPR) repeat protein
VDAKPEFEIGHFNLGVINFKEKNLDEAEKNYVDALTIKPDDLDARQNLSAIYILQERYDEAIDQLKKVIESNPDDDTTLENANFNLGVAYLRQKKYKESLSAFESAIQIEPWDMAAYVNSAIIAEELGLNEKAIKYWQRYDRLLPTNKRKKEIKAKLKKLGAKVTEDGATETPVVTLAPAPGGPEETAAPAPDEGNNTEDSEGTLEK